MTLHNSVSSPQTSCVLLTSTKPHFLYNPIADKLSAVVCTRTNLLPLSCKKLLANSTANVPTP